MKLSIQKRDIQNAPTEAFLEHNGRSMAWNIAILDRATVGDSTEIFDEINAFWGCLPHGTQDAIFAIFQSIRDLFDSDQGYDTQQLSENLMAPIEELCRYHSLADLRHWVDFKSNLIIPVDLDEKFDENADNRTRDRTYLREDYRQLLALAIATRFMVPIWGEFIARTKAATGSVYKEFYASKLLMRSTIGHSEAMLRLRLYVEQSIPAEKSKTPAIFGGVGTEEFPDWVLGLILVRRMTVVDLRGLNPEINVVKTIYRFVNQKSRQHDANFIGMVRDKNTEGGGPEGSENNISSLESYKVKQEFTDGEIAALVAYVEDVPRMARKTCPDIPDDLLRESEQSVQVMADEMIQPVQVTIIQWVLAKTVSPRGISYLPKLSLIRTMAAAQAILWHKGHYELAGFVSAITQDNNSSLQVLGVDSRARIPAELRDELDRLYPYSKQAGSKAKPTRRPNAAIAAIDLMETELSKNAWRLTLPADWVVKLTGNKNNRRYLVPHEIKIKLANFVLALQARNNK